MFFRRRLYINIRRNHSSEIIYYVSKELFIVLKLYKKNNIFRILFKEIIILFCL
jgi:hypothetical protein